MKKLTLLVIFVSFWSINCFGQSSASLIVNGKWGSESIPFFIDSYGNKVTLSTGSGISAGGEYSYDFSWLFNLSADAMFHYTALSQKAKNASGKFMAMEVLLTPSLTFPSKPNPRLKVLIGAGPGLYSFGTIKIDATEAGGEIIKLKYKPTIGYHGQILFKIKFQDNTFISIGGKYSMISYTYTQKGSTHNTIDKRISNPDGSGLALVVAIGGNF
jgi:hypothetical protein